MEEVVGFFVDLFWEPISRVLESYPTVKAIIQVALVIASVSLAIYEGPYQDFRTANSQSGVGVASPVSSTWLLNSP